MSPEMSLSTSFEAALCNEVFTRMSSKINWSASIYRRQVCVCVGEREEESLNSRCAVTTSYITKRKGRGSIVIVAVGRIEIR